VQVQFTIAARTMALWLDDGFTISQGKLTRMIVVLISQGNGARTS
jgi:hypothetical protein